MIFAAVCTFINLGSQFLMGVLLAPVDILNRILFTLKLNFLIQLATGTILGFLAKFILDKFVVFQEKHESAAGTVKQIFIYGLLAVVTTIIFWAFEIGFEKLFHFEQADLVGGFIGLVIGYTVKFFLDRKFVFPDKRQVAGEKSSPRLNGYID